VRGDAVPDRVLLGAGQHGDGLGELAVGGQRPVGVQVGAQDVGQDDRVAVVGLAARDRVPVPVAGHRHRVDRVDVAACARHATSSPRGVSIATGIGSPALSPCPASSLRSGRGPARHRDPAPEPGRLVHDRDVVVVLSASRSHQNAFN
jgi:hypothetical protein